LVTTTEKKEKMSMLEKEMLVRQRDETRHKQKMERENLRHNHIMEEIERLGKYNITVFARDKDVGRHDVTEDDGDALRCPTCGN
jgi:hypothetical protein